MLFHQSNDKKTLLTYTALNPQSGRPSLPPLIVQAAATTTQQQTAGSRLGALSYS